MQNEHAQTIKRSYARFVCGFGSSLSLSFVIVFLLFLMAIHVPSLLLQPLPI